MCSPRSAAFRSVGRRRNHRPPDGVIAPAFASLRESDEERVATATAGSVRGLPSSEVQPAGGRVEGVGRGAVEGDRGIGSVSSHQVDHLLEQLELVANTATDRDALPPSGAQGVSDDRLHVVAAIEAEQAGLNADAVLGEPGYADLNRLGHRLGIPWPGNPVRVESDHENPGSRSRAHFWTLRRGGRWARSDPPFQTRTPTSRRSSVTV